jgi:hypothetical protein
MENTAGVIGDFAFDTGIHLAFGSNHQSKIRPVWPAFFGGHLAVD